LPFPVGSPQATEVFTPLPFSAADRVRGGPRSYQYFVIGRLKDGVTVDQAREDISAIARRIYEESNEKTDYLLRDGTVVPLQDSITGTARSPLLILLGAVGFLLLVACANVANLLLAQASVRERELSIRSALGASRGRLVRQFLTEAFLLSLVGGVLGVLAALSGVSGLVSLAPENLPRVDQIKVDDRIFFSLDQPMDETLLLANYEPTEDLAARTKKVREAAEKFESETAFSVARNARASTGIWSISCL